MNSISYLSLLLIFAASCAQGTSTPDSYINRNKISNQLFIKDGLLLKDALLIYHDSLNHDKILNIDIDTIFYGDNDKIVFLAILSQEDIYVDKGYKYLGECYIAYKAEKIKDIYKLKYISTSTESPGKTSKMLRNIYLTEMNLIRDQYNINDVRFWDSEIWDEAKNFKRKMKHFENSKKNNPQNVYDPTN